MRFRFDFLRARRMGAGLIAAFALVAIMSLAGPAPAQAQSVADVRADLDVLNGQIQQLRDQLVRQGGARGLPTEPATALERLDQLEARLRELTGRVDVLSNDIERIVTDASNRVGDIEFRLTEIEGGDTSILGTGEELGGGLSPRPRARSQAAAPSAGAQPEGAVGGTGTAELAVTEQSDFQAAATAVQDGRNAEAVAMFDRFLATYPGGPLSSKANLLRGDALAAQGQWQEAARSYLGAFSGAPQAETAPTALFSLADSFAKIGKTQEACLTFSEVSQRYPSAPEAGRVAAARAALSCP